MTDQTPKEPQDDSPAADTPAPTGDSAPPASETAPVSPKGKTPAETAAPDTTAAPKRPSAWPGYVGLLIALLAAAGVGYLWNERRVQLSLNTQFTDTQRELATRSAELGRLTGDMERLGSTDARLDADLDALAKRIERQLEELPARMTRVETTLDKIPGVAEQARSAWLLAEAEYFLRVAHAQLDLVGNVDVSLRALDLADAKLKDLGDPGLTRVRAKLSDERTALKAVPRPDAEGIVLELGSLAQSLNTLPLSRTAPGRFVQETTPGDETGWQRAWRVIVDALSGIISVRRNDETVTPLMSATEEAMLIRSLDVELQIARLAVIRNQGTLYRKSLQAVANRLGQYFDTNSPAVRAAQETVGRLAEADLPGELPDISGSLKLLLTLGDEAAAP